MKQNVILEELKIRLSKAGFFKPSTTYYAIKCTIIILSYCSFYCLALYFSEKGEYSQYLYIILCALSATLMGGIGHDATHNVVHSNRNINDLFGIIGFSLFNGTSYRLWHNVHNQHHTFTQIKPGSPKKCDPDLKDNAWFSSYKESGDRKTGFVRKLHKFQGYYFPVIAIFYVFALRAEGINFLIKNKKILVIEILSVLVHNVLWIIIPVYYFDINTALLNYLLFTIITSLYFLLLFLPNHAGLEYVKDEQEYPSWKDQIQNSRNIRLRKIFDHFYCGLNFHIEHHLFPGVGVNNLRKGSKIMKEFCDEQGITYTEVGLFDGIKAVLGNLFNIGRYLRKTKNKNV